MVNIVKFVLSIQVNCFYTIVDDNLPCKFRTVFIFLADDLMVMLVCGSDLLESFSTPGVWIPEQVK